MDEEFVPGIPADPLRGPYYPGQPSVMGPNLRINRAREHVKNLEPRLRDYANRPPYRASADPRREGEWWVMYVEEIIEWPDPSWSVIISEVIHQLRAALDNLVWQMVLLEGKEEPGRHTQFPIYADASKPERISKGLARMLTGVSVGHRALIEEIQPYQGPCDDVAISRIRFGLDNLVVLSDHDKHRFLHAVFGRRETGFQARRVITDPPGTEVEIVAQIGSLYEGAELFRWRTPGNPDAKVVVEARLPTDIVFGYADLGIYWFEDLVEEVANIVARVEPDFPTE